MRALAQSLAREFGPKGVHVAHAIIDGVIDIERTKDWKFDVPDAKISPHAVSSQTQHPEIKHYVRWTKRPDTFPPDCGFILVPAHSTPDMLHQ